MSFTLVSFLYKRRTSGGIWRKKKTLASLGDGDPYNDKKNRKKQPHQ